MSRDNNNILPSYKDFLEKPDDDLPSLEEVLEENLPSVDDFLSESIVEDTQTIENSDGESFLEVSDVIQAPEWSELVRLVNDVRKDIPQLPEIKSYDEELEQLGVQITQIQTNFSLLDAKSDKIKDLSAQNEEFGVKLSEIESKIPEVPEIRYYEEDIRFIHDKITRIKGEIDNLPEVKYYENDLETLKSRIEEVNKTIPTFPDWVQKVQEVPDFSWIGKTFSIIDDDFNKVQGHLDIIRDKIDYQVNELTESLEKKEFELNVDIKRIDKELTDTSTVFNETKNNLYKEMRDCSTRLWEHQKTFKDDDRKLKKSILSEQNKLKQTLQKEIKDINEQSVKTDQSILKFFTDLKESIENQFSSLPEVKYYDEDISKLQKEVKITKSDVKDLVDELHEIASVIKKQQKNLSEGLLNEPPDQKETAGGQTDPLTPMDQKFATLKDLANHYRLFINRIQTQMATMGGGGAGFIKDLDDVTFDQTTGTNELLIYNGAKWVGIASTAIGSSTSKLVELTDVDTTNLGDGRFLRYDASNDDFTFEPVSATNLELIAGDIQSGVLTTTSTSAATVMSISASIYRSVSYQIQVSEGSNFNMTTINVIHNGTETFMSEFGTIHNSTGIATFSTDINGGSLRLLGFPASSNSTTFKVIFTAIQV